MKRIWTIRLFPRLLIVSLAIILSMAVFSFMHPRTTCSDDANTNGEGKCEGGHSQSQFVLWETLTHNLLASQH
ncbi:MAG TPA: hypothetical protein VN616_03520 [Puia sp.]|nr:hypothetical protein [Puia sp.]